MSTKTSQILSYVLLGLSALISIIFVSTVDETGQKPIVDFFLNYIYLLFIVCTLACTVVSLVVSIVNDPRSILKFLAGILAIGVVFAISIGISSSEVLPSYEPYEITELTSKTVGGYLRMVYILGAVAVMAIVYDTVVGLIK